MPETPSHTALLTDFGGVLTTDIWSSFESFCKSRGLERDAAKKLFRSNPEALKELRGLETGATAPDEFADNFAKLLGTEPAGLVEGLFAGLGPDQLMVDAVAAARAAGIPTGLVSNSWGMDIYDQELLKSFDALVISGEVGLHKPQPEIYLMAAERIGAPPEACVFVDDLRENCAGAEAVGMTTVLHRDSKQSIAQMARLLGVSLS